MTFPHSPSPGFLESNRIWSSIEIVDVSGRKFTGRWLLVLDRMQRKDPPDRNASGSDASIWNKIPGTSGGSGRGLCIHPSCDTKVGGYR